jgi:16S rRNA (adenine1518-N6/adenine1519-N6)-dimethyltransferase
VDSVLVVLRRRATAPPDIVRNLVHAGFAHRRKALAGSLALAPGGTPELRDAARAALEAIGLAADTRAERLGPEQWTSLAAVLGPEMAGRLAPRGTI